MIWTGLLQQFQLGLWLLLLSSAFFSGLVQATNPPVDLVRLTVPGCERRIAHDRDYESIAIGSALYWNLESDLIVRIIEKGERNTGWDEEAESPKGAVGLAQIMPETVCRMMGKKECTPTLTRLGQIAERLKHDVRWHLCWSGKILHHLTLVCRGEKLCRAMIYNAGDAGLKYSLRVEP